MKTQMLWVFILPVYLAYPQGDIKKFTFGSHDVELSINISTWNYSMESKDRYEFLNGCSGDEKCANIQVGFSRDVDENASTDSMVDYVMQEFKKASPDATFVRGTVSLGDRSVPVLDTRFDKGRKFLGQTVLVLMSPKKELLTICYTGTPEKPEGWARSYSMQRAAFIEICKTVTLLNRGPDYERISCNDTITHRIDRFDQYWHYISTNGKTEVSKNGKYYRINGQAFVSHFDHKDDALSRHFNTAGKMENFISMKSTLMQYQASQKLEEPPYFETFPVDILDGKRATIWRIVYYKDKKVFLLPLSRMVYISIDLGSYYYSIQTEQSETQSLDDVKAILMRWINSLRYQASPFDTAALCQAK